MLQKVESDFKSCHQGHSEVRQPVLSGRLRASQGVRPGAMCRCDRVNLSMPKIHHMCGFGQYRTLVQGPGSNTRLYKEPGRESRREALTGPLLLHTRAPRCSAPPKAHRGRDSRREALTGPPFLHTRAPRCSAPPKAHRGRLTPLPVATLPDASLLCKHDMLYCMQKGCSSGALWTFFWLSSVQGVRTGFLQQGTKSDCGAELLIPVGIMPVALNRLLNMFPKAQKTTYFAFRQSPIHGA
eukprot:1160388-Pelagomonas_calceolata.AAC.3